MSQVPKVRKIKDQAELDAIMAASKADNDGCLLPTHVVIKNGEIVGCASLAVLPVMMVWNHSTKVGPRDSIQLKHTYDAIMEEKGAKSYAILCNKQSPYNGHMKQLGFKPVWETQIFVND
jgi:hypothetical protein